MKKEQLNLAEAAARSFLASVENLRNHLDEYELKSEYVSGKNAATVRRRSMDLTNALADLRRR